MFRSILMALAGLLVFSCPAWAPAAEAQSVVTYHNAPDRSGQYIMPGLTLTAASTIHLDSGFSASFAGNVYAQPLYWAPSGGPKLLIVATESNTVYGLNADTGVQVWKTQPAPSARLSALGCGNIDPEGITGTPVIDPATGTLYLDALVSAGGVPRQRIYALSATTGAVLPHWPIDVQSQAKARSQTFDSTIQGERSALQFVGGKLYVNYAGRFGDCGDYHGVVIEVTPSKRALTGFWATRAKGGGIWAQGGVASDGTSLFATTGNTFGANGWQDGEAVVRLRTGLAHSTKAADYFTPRIWQTLDNEDLDLGGSGAVPLSVPAAGGKTAARVLALGKNGYAYLLDAADLGGIGHALASLQLSNSEIITEPAVFQAKTYTIVTFTNPNGAQSSCAGNANLTALMVTASATGPISVLWCANIGGFGTPIATTTDGSANPINWVVDTDGDGRLLAFNALTGQQLYSGGGITMNGLRRYSTLIAANNHLYVAADGTVYAFTF
jgi:outer membrane protein assembly factor BamB